MKVLERVLEKRIGCQVSIYNMQFGFMPGKGTTDAIFIMRQVQEKLYTSSNILDLWMSPESGAPADQVEKTPGRASLEKLGCRTPPQQYAGGVGRQQQLLGQLYHCALWNS